MNTVLALGMPGMGEWLIIALVFLLPVFALIDILRHQFKGANDKLIWVVVVLFLPMFGSILYFIIGRSQRLTN
ncbi:MAG: PLDc N-terminal domain-containing protein [Cyclobacteriaceae bacterium]|nr:PLDc N-terminal domain-containing protein [Cyclobacteriaceae bacterium]